MLGEDSEAGDVVNSLFCPMFDLVPAQQSLFPKQFTTKHTWSKAICCTHNLLQIHSAFILYRCAPCAKQRRPYSVIC